MCRQWCSDPTKCRSTRDPHCVQKEMVCLGLCGMSEGSSASVETARRMSALLCKIWAVMVGFPMPKDFVKIWYRLLEVAARKSTGAGEGTRVWARGGPSRVSEHVFHGTWARDDGGQFEVHRYVCLQTNHSTRDQWRARSKTASNSSWPGLLPPRSGQQQSLRFGIPWKSGALRPRRQMPQRSPNCQMVSP